MINELVGEEQPCAKAPILLDRSPAVLLVEYHIGRNKVACQSHTKTWLARHKGVKLQRQ
jgi:hypothetical protein